ncbi:MAG: phosphoenolpyruvate--protein phosphotransferase [Spirochaetes bacterium]|nr:phosphoenolpyruvate--protein phosphotransferase [Spirochaetota bacterium]
MMELKGIPASPGIVTGKAFLYLDDNPPIPKYDISPSIIPLELERFEEAQRKAIRELEILKQRTNSEMSEETVGVLDSHLMLLQDPEVRERIVEELYAQKKNIEWVIHMTIQSYLEKLNHTSDPYLRERTADINDVTRRVLNHLLHRERISLSDIGEEVILVGKDLLPSEAIAMNKRMILGIALDEGGKTSHTAILARAFEIPAVLGLREITKHVHTGDEILIDGNRGIVILKPDEATKTYYMKTLEARTKKEVELLSLNELPAETKDGKLICLMGNIEVPEEVEALKGHGAEGVGLYRSEFLFLNPGRLPSEQMQYEAYRRVLEAMEGKTVTIRTLDLGGDKIIPDLVDANEKNPLLGWRAIRFCLSRVNIFRTQLRALFRASVHGKLQIMFPMISGIEELNQTLELVEQVKQDLRSEGVPFNEKVAIGCMIEIPSAALTSDVLARKVEFFSIGTNDLIQYTIAVDRGNQRTAYLYEPFHPAVLRLIRMTVENAHAVGIPVAMCGEMAGDPLATVILLGLGLDELSMNAFSIPAVKKIIRSVSMAEAEELVGTVMEMRSGKEIDTYVRQLMEKRFDLNTY